MDAISVTSLITTTLSLTEFQHQVLWILIAGAVLAFCLGFALGANDVSNAFGTSVGSKVITIRQAYCLATITETAGAILIGYNIVDTIRKGVVDVNIYEGEERLFFLGQLGVLGGCSTWLMTATILDLPISAAHSMVGATMGFSIVLKGTKGIDWNVVYKIAASWVISPVFSASVSEFFYILLDIAVLRRRNPVERGLMLLPIFYFFCIAFNVFNVASQGSKLIGLEAYDFKVAVVIGVVGGLVVALVYQFILRPMLLRYIGGYGQGEDVVKPTVVLVNLDANSKVHDLPPSSTPNELAVQPSPTTIQEEDKQVFTLNPKGFVHWLFPVKHREEDEHALRLFSTIQVFTACFAGFAHGASDVSNTIAPLAAMLAVYQEGSVRQEQPVSIWVFVFGATAIVIGLWVLGHRIIKVVGTKMSHIHPASGFTIEFGAAVTSIIAANLGLPISFTHSIVGSVVAVGTIKAGHGVDWSTFRTVALSWVLTLPITIGLSAIYTFILTQIAY